MPKFSSREEYEQWKEQKLQESGEKAQRRRIAEDIMRHSPTSDAKELFEKKAPPEPFIKLLPGIFSYPFNGDGKYILIGGVVLFSILSIMIFMASYVPIYGAVFLLLLGVFVGGYLGSYMMKIIASSASGENDAPDWPDFTDFWDDIINPFFLMFGTTLFSFSPVIVYVLFFSSKVILPVSLLISGFLIVIGSLYFPMALLAVAQMNTLRALNPGHVVLSIIKVPLDYLIACGVLLLVIISSSAARVIFALSIPYIGLFIYIFLFLYFLMIEMRILGLLYYANQERLNWFGEGEEV